MNQARRNKIVALLDEQGTVTNAELIDTFGISIETVRRDLAYLEECGLLERVYGGAVKKRLISVEPKYNSRENENEREKTAIACEAEKMISSNESVFFDLGTTVLSIARRLDEKKKIRAFTNSLRSALALSEKGQEVTITGGRLRGGEFSVSGSIAEETMKHFNIDKAIIGVAGITEDGITDFIPEEAFIREKVIKNAKKVIAVADYSKFGIRVTCNVCAIEDIDVLITDEKAPKKLLKALEKKGVQVVIAKI